MRLDEIERIAMQSELERALNRKSYLDHSFEQAKPTFQQSAYNTVDSFGKALGLKNSSLADGLIGRRNHFGLMDLTGFSGVSENIARDTGRGLAQGNYGDVAKGFGLLGLETLPIGRIAKKVTGPVIKKGKEVVSNVKNKMTRTDAVNQGFIHPLTTPSLANGKSITVDTTKLRPIDDMSSIIVPFKNTKTPKIITPEDLYNQKLAGIATKGDRTNVGLLTEIDGVPLEKGVGLYGGGRFADINPNIWASDKTRVGTIGKRATGLLKEGYNPATVFTTSAHDSLRFNTMLTDGFLQEIRTFNLPKKTIKEFDDSLRKIRPEWLGINHPQAREQLYLRGAGALRTEFNEIGSQAKFRNMGFPEIAPIKKAITDPKLIDTPNMYSGYRVGKIDPDNMIITNPSMPHPTYNTHVGGTQVGELGTQMPFAELFPDFIAGRRLLGKPVIKDARSAELAFPTQKFDQQWLDSVMPKYEKRMAQEKLKQQGLLDTFSNPTTNNPTKSGGLLQKNTSSVWDDPIQAITSANTSVNKTKTAAAFTQLTKEKAFKKGSVNIDIGGGKFDNADELLQKSDATNLVYDPFNRTKAHNANVVDAVSGGNADTATINNVLNVIDGEANQLKVLNQAKDAVKKDGKVYISVFEGKKDGVGRVTSKDSYQQDKKAAEYLDLVKKVFPDAKLKNGIIRATNN
tara:strand:- start:458 stop:2512 length:2055 start_codon:yes stop_codon:yes gene_type:complete